MEAAEKLIKQKVNEADRNRLNEEYFEQIASSGGAELISGSIARRYAKALLAIGVETKNYEKLGNELEQFAALMGHKELRETLENPSYPLSKRKAIIEQLIARIKPLQDDAELPPAAGRPQPPGARCPASTGSTRRWSTGTRARARRGGERHSRSTPPT